MHRSTIWISQKKETQKMEVQWLKELVAAQTMAFDILNGPIIVQRACVLHADHYLAKLSTMEVS